MECHKVFDDLSIGFKSVSATGGGEKQHATFDCWIGTPGGQWLARIDEENEKMENKNIMIPTFFSNKDCIANRGEWIDV